MTMILNTEKIKEMEREMRELEAQYARQRLLELRENILLVEAEDLDQQPQ